MLSFSLFDQSIPSILSGASNGEAGAGLWSFVLVVDSLYELVAGQAGRLLAGCGCATGWWGRFSS